MHFYLLSALILASFIRSGEGLYYTISKDDYNVAGLPMQFNITVSGSAYPFYFRFDLFENVTNSSAYLEDVREASKSFIFPATTPPGNYSLKVQVYFVFDMIRLMKISGPGHIEFEVKNKLGGNITYTQENLRQSAYRENRVACCRLVSFRSESDDFHHYLQNATYNWYINGTLVPNITDSQMNTTLQTEDWYNVTATSTGVSKENLTVNVRTEKIVQAIKPLDNLNLTGIPNISWKRNRNLEIDVNFVNGTKPFWYCYKLFTEEKSKLICNDPDETTEDHFRVTKRFSKNGTYYLKIKAGNIVTKLEKSFPITVIDFEKQSQMLFVIIPIVAFISILTIVFAGILVYVKNKNKFMTEVADFNFEQKSQVDSLTEERFFQRLKNTFLSSMRSFGQSINDLFRRNEETLVKRMENVNEIDGEDEIG